MEPLFDKSMDELREAFVRARFAEPNIFDRPDIEEWLEGQVNNLRQDVDSDFWKSCGFETHLDHKFHSSSFNKGSERAAHILRECVTAGGRQPAWADPRLTSIVDVLHRADVEIFYRYLPGKFKEEPVAIIILGEKAFSVISNNDETDCEVARLDTTMVGEVIAFLMEEVCLARPKAQKALEFLLREYKLAIDKIRESAQHDFDEAVAVSANGTKIVKAKWVLVGSDGENWKNHVILYPAEAFHGQKIRSRGRETRKSINMSHLVGLDYISKEESLVANLLQLLFRNMIITRSLWNLYLKDETGRDIFESLYLADFQSCPSPLPQGGRKIQIKTRLR